MSCEIIVVYMQNTSVYKYADKARKKKKKKSCTDAQKCESKSKIKCVALS